jgi:hypothetical protein
MSLVYDSRRATRDIDAVFQPHGVVLEEARAVAEELGLPQWWLNEQASVYIAPGGDSAASRVFDHPGLRVSAASPEHLLAMKVLAGSSSGRRRREGVGGAPRTHVGRPGAGAVRGRLPGGRGPPRARLILDGLFDHE